MRRKGRNIRRGKKERAKAGEKGYMYRNGREVKKVKKSKKIRGGK